MKMTEKQKNDLIRSHGFVMIKFRRHGDHVWFGGPFGRVYNQEKLLKVIARYEEKRQARDE